jgi:hypothetical protein
MAKVKFDWDRFFKMKEKPRNVFTIETPAAEGNKFNWSTKQMKK